jgi:hypothetical protein
MICWSTKLVNALLDIQLRDCDSFFIVNLAIYLSVLSATNLLQSARPAAKSSVGVPHAGGDAS